jgi:hypothetical protein
MREVNEMVRAVYRVLYSGNLKYRMASVTKLDTGKNPLTAGIDATGCLFFKLLFCL